MINRGFVGQIGQNVGVYASQFRNTGDLKWLVRFAQESKLYEGLVKNQEKEGVFKIHPLTVADFVNCLFEANSTSLADKIQDLLGKTVAASLAVFYSKAEPTAPAFKTNAPGALEDVLTDDLIISSDELEEINQLFVQEIGKRSLPDREQDILLEIAKDEKRLGSAIKYVLTKGFLRAVGLNYWKNPILELIPQIKNDGTIDQVKKVATAATVKEEERKITPDSRGPRLSNLLEALQIVGGGYTVELARVQALIDEHHRKKGFLAIPDELQSRKTKAQQMVVVIDAYSDYLSRMKEGLEDFMNMDPSHEYLVWGNKARDFITRDPLIRSSVSEIEKMGDFFRGALHERHPAKFIVEDWHGTKITFGTFAHGVGSAITKFYAVNKMKKPDYVDELTTKMFNNASHAANYFLVERKPVRLRQLLSMFGATVDVSKIHDDVIKTLKNAIPNLPADFSQNKEREVLEMEKNKNFEEDYETKLLAALSQAKDTLLERYGALIKTERKDFQNFVNSAANDIRGLSPLDIYRLKLADFKLSEKSANIVSARMTELFVPQEGGKSGLVQQIFNSKAFRTKFAENEADFRGYDEEHSGDIPTQFIVSIEEGRKLLESPESEQIRAKLGIVNLPVAEHDEYSKQFDQMIMRVLWGRPRQETKKILGRIPFDSLLVYLSDIFISVMESHIVCQSACRFAGAKEIRELLESGEDLDNIRSGGEFYEGCPCSGIPISAAAYDEAQIFVNQYLKRIRQQRRSESDRLSSQSGGGIIRDWISVPELAPKEKPNFTAVFIERSRAAFGAFIRDKSSEKIQAFFETNLDEKEAAKRENREFRFNDKINPRPTNWKELMELVGAYADPVPSKAPEFSEDLILGTEQRRSEDVSLKEFEGDERFSLGSADTARKHINRMVYRVMGFGGGFQDPVGELRRAFIKRREQIEQINPDATKLIVPFKIDAVKELMIDGKPEKVNVSNDPFNTGYVKEVIQEKDKSPEEKKPGFLVHSKDDAMAFIDSIADLLPARLALSVKKMISGIAPNSDDPVYSTTEDFFDFFCVEIVPVLEETSEAAKANVDEILNRLMPGRQRPTQEEDAPAQKSDELVKIRAELGRALKDMLLAIKSPQAISYADLTDQVQKMTVLKKDIQDLFTAARAQSPEIQHGIEDLTTALIQNLEFLRQEIVLRNQALEEIKESERMTDVGSVRELIERILMAVAQPEFKIVNPANKLPVPKEQVRLFLEKTLKSLLWSNEQGTFKEAIPLLEKVLSHYLGLISTNRLSYKELRDLIPIVDEARNKNRDRFLVKLEEE